MSINNKRLNLIASEITDRIVYDIGSDHGYLPLVLLNEDKVDEVFICEKNKQPLDNAYKNFKRHDKLDCGNFILSDGFLDITKLVDHSSIVIAGMGGNLIADIVSGGLDKLNQTHTLYLQANNNLYNLRKFLSENGFEIIKEYMVEENDIINEIIQCKKVSMDEIKLDNDFLLFGYQDVKYKDLFLKLHTQKLNHLEGVLKKVVENNQENKKVEKEIEILKNKLGEI